MQKELSGISDDKFDSSSVWGKRTGRALYIPSAGAMQAIDGASVVPLFLIPLLLSHSLSLRSHLVYSLLPSDQSRRRDWAETQDCYCRQLIVRRERNIRQERFLSVFFTYTLTIQFIWPWPLLNLVRNRRHDYQNKFEFLWHHSSIRRVEFGPGPILSKLR